MPKINEIKRQLVQAINNNPKYTLPKKGNSTAAFIWVGTKDNLIGNSTCHYEFLFKKNKLFIDTGWTSFKCYF